MTIVKVDNKVDEIKRNFETSVPVMNDKVTKALAALSQVTKVDSDQEDEIANKLLQKVRATYNVVSSMRKEITDPMDQLKSDLMQFEKKIDTKKGSDSDYNRVKILRDQYASKKAEEARKRAEEIEHKKRVQQEEVRVKSEMKIAVESGVIKLIADGQNMLSKALQNVTLESYDDLMKKLNYKPTLKLETFQSWLDVPYSKSLMSDDKFTELLKKAEEAFNFEHVAKTYSDEATELLKKYRNEYLPEKRAKLEKIASLAEADKKRAEELAKEEEDNFIKEQKRRLEDEQHQKIETARDEQNEELLNAEFEAQVQSQSIEQQSGVRKTLSLRLSADAEKRPAFAIEALTKLMTHVLSHPESRGLFRRDSQGFPKTDDKGRPVYIEGIDYWLKEAARLKIDCSSINNIDQTINTTSIAR